MPRRSTPTDAPSMTKLAIVTVDIAQQAEKLGVNVLDLNVDGIYRLVRVHVFGGHAEGDDLIDRLLTNGATLGTTDTAVISSGVRRAVDLTHTGVRVIVSTTVVARAVAA